MKTDMLKWHSTSARLPENEMLVLMKCDDGYHVARYDKANGEFKLRGGALLKPADCEKIYWIAITPP